MEWQPIATAPRDGTWFVAVMAGFLPTIVRWHDKGWQDMHDDDGDSWSAATWELTHWLIAVPEWPGKKKEMR